MMNNSSTFSKLTNTQRTKMYELISFAVVDSPSLAQVQMCNCGVNDEFMGVLMDAFKAAGMTTRPLSHKLIVIFRCLFHRIWEECGQTVVVVGTRIFAVNFVII